MYGGPAHYRVELNFRIYCMATSSRNLSEKLIHESACGMIREFLKRKNLSAVAEIFDSEKVCGLSSVRAVAWLFFVKKLFLASVEFCNCL